MFRLSREELQRRRAAKPIQTTEEMFEALCFDDLVEPGVKVEMSTAFHGVFERYARIVNPKGGGENVFVFDVHCLLESMCRTWEDLYGTVATFREEVLRDKALLEQEVRKLLDSEDGLVKKLAGELDVCLQPRIVQDLLMQRGTAIANLEKQLSTLSLKPLHFSKHHIESNAGEDQAAGSQKPASSNLEV